MAIVLTTTPTARYVRPESSRPSYRSYRPATPLFGPYSSPGAIIQCTSSLRRTLGVLTGVEFPEPPDPRNANLPTLNRVESLFVGTWIPGIWTASPFGSRAGS